MKSPQFFIRHTTKFLSRCWFKKLPILFFSAALLIALGLTGSIPMKSMRSRATVVTQPAATFTVTNTADSGPGSLRQAIINANANPTADVIDFSIQEGPQTIFLSSPLPSITQPLTIDGTTQPDFPGSAIIRLDGAGAGQAFGIIIETNSCTVRGLAINNFSRDGILIVGNNNKIEGNSISFNVGNGVIILDSTGNTIGGTTPGRSNAIVSNGLNGVAVQSGSANSISGNTIVFNDSLGIDLNEDGVTANDPGDGDQGANNLQNFPVLTSASPTNVQGVLDSTANANFRIEFFSNALCDPSGNGEGDKFLGFTNVTTNDSGIANINFPGQFTSGQFITATATAPTNDTSEFSACIRVPDPCAIFCPNNQTRNADPGQCGATVSYPAPNTSGECGAVTCLPPSGSFFSVGNTIVNCASAAGPACSFTVTVIDNQPPAIVCPNNVTVTAQQGQNSAVVNYPAPAVADNCPGVIFACAPPSGSAFPVGTTAVACTATDATGNNSNCGFLVTVNESSAIPANLSITKTASQPAVASGEKLTYSIKVGNAGPGVANNVTVTDILPADTTFSSLTLSQGGFTAPNAGSTGLVTVSLGSIPVGGEANIQLEINVLAASDTTLSNTATVTSSSSAGSVQATATTPVKGGGIIVITWEQLPSTLENPTPAPQNVQVNIFSDSSPNAPSINNFFPPARLSSVRGSLSRASILPLADEPCTLIQVNIYKSNASPADPIPANLWKSVPPSLLKTVMAAAPSAQFYTLTNVWDCNGTKKESARSNEPAIPAGPLLNKVKLKLAKIKITGTGFSNTVEVSVDGVGFIQNAKVKAGNLTVVQKGNLVDGRSLLEATPSGKTVVVSIRNSDGGISSMSRIR